MTELLGYERHAVEGWGSADNRNGSDWHSDHPVTLVAMSLEELQTWPGPESESPFRWRLVVEPGWSSPHIRRFDGDARFVVRLIPSLQLASCGDLLEVTMRLHGELESIGIGVPPRLYVRGSRHRDGSPQAFVVARVVDGAPLVEAAATNARAVHGIDRVCVALVDYYDRKYRQGGPRLSDIKLEQFVFGALDGEAQPWMVDLDPGYVSAPPMTGDGRALASLHWRVAEVVRIVTAVERVAGSRLASARRRLEGLFASPMFDHPSARERPAMLAEALATGSEVDGAGWVREQLRAGA
jgi:hypothetical protein